jgi:hypothetical protein
VNLSTGDPQPNAKAASESSVINRINGIIVNAGGG